MGFPLTEVVRKVSKGTTMRYLFVLFLLIAQTSLANDVLELSFGYKDSSIYQITQESSSVVNVEYSGDLEKLPLDSKFRQPMNAITKQKVKHSIETGNRESTGAYSIKLVTGKKDTLISLNGSDFFEPQNMGLGEVEVMGMISPGGKIEFKSVSGKRVTDEVRMMMKNVIEQLADANPIAGRSVSVGETISTHTPLSMPIGNMGTVNLEVKVDYTLESIQENIAKFTTESRFIISADLELSHINLVGSGTGVMTYDITNKISPITDTEMKISYRIPMEDGFLETTAIDSSSIRTSVEQKL